MAELAESEWLRQIFDGPETSTQSQEAESSIQTGKLWSFEELSVIQADLFSVIVVTGV